MPTTPSKSAPPRAISYRWVMLAVYYLGGIAFGITFQSIPALLPLIIADLRLSYAEAGSLQSLFALLGFLLAIPVGLMADRRHGERSILVAAYSAMIVGTLVVATASSYPMLLVGRLIAGAGGFSTTITVARLVSHWFTGRELGVGMGLHSTAMPVATILSLSLLGDFGRAAGWPIAALIGPGITTIALLALLLFYRPSPGSRIGSSRPLAGQSLLRKTMSVGLPVWLVGMIWLWFNASTLSFLTFGPTYFSARGFGLGIAGFLSSVQMMGSLFVSPLVGFLLDKYRRPELYMGIGSLLVAFAITLIPTSLTPILVPLCILSIGSAFIPTSVLYLPSEVARPQDRGLAFGIINTCLTAGIIVGPFLVGLARDASGSYELGFAMMAAFAVMGGATASILKIVRKKTVTRHVLEG